MFTQFDRNTHKVVMDRALKALKAIEDELGVSFVNGGGATGGAEGVIKIGVKIRSVNGHDPAKLSFENMGRFYGFDGALYGAAFIRNGVVYKITGYNPRAPKMPVLANRLHDNAPFKFTRAVLAEAKAKAA